MSAPALVTVAHGTRVAVGNRVAAAITAQASRRLAVPAQGSYVELCDPGLGSVMRTLEQPAVVVPLLLSTGFHMRADIPAAASLAGTHVQVARPLGPHPLLAEVMCLRLRGDGEPAGRLSRDGGRDPVADGDAGAVGHGHEGGCTHRVPPAGASR